MLRKGKGFAGIALAGLVLTACSQAPLPGVKVRSLSTEIGLGVVKAQAPVQGIEPPPIDLPEPFRPPSQPPFSIPDFCPSAGLFDFPDVIAPTEIVGRPEVGSYLWKYDATSLDDEKLSVYLGREISGVGTIRFYAFKTVTASIPDSAEAVLKSVYPDLDRDSTLYTINSQPHIGLPTPTTLSRGDQYRVQKKSYAKDAPAPAGDVGEGVQMLTTSWAEGNPEDPTTLKFWLMANTPAPLIFTLPPVVGKTIKWNLTAQAVNPLLLAVPFAPTNRDLVTAAAEQGPRITMTYTGQIAGKKQVDACGDLVDSWLVDGVLTQTIERVEAGEAPVVYKYDYSYAIATQMGGLMVYERLAYPATESAISSRGVLDKEVRARVKPFVVLESSIGQIEPTTD